MLSVSVIWYYCYNSSKGIYDQSKIDSNGSSKIPLIIHISHDCSVATSSVSKIYLDFDIDIDLLTFLSTLKYFKFEGNSFGTLPYHLFPSFHLTFLLSSNLYYYIRTAVVKLWVTPIILISICKKHKCSVAILSV